MIAPFASSIKMFFSRTPFWQNRDKKRIAGKVKNIAVTKYNAAFTCMQLSPILQFCFFTT
jgi:hypothetical protein